MLNIQPTDTPVIKKYFDWERAMRGTVGGIYVQNSRALEMFARGDELVAVGGEAEAMGELHAANIEILQGGHALLIQQIQATNALIKAMQAGAYEATGSVLFDGVPLPEVEEVE
jgi:hypothetical protein